MCGRLTPASSQTFTVHFAYLALSELNTRKKKVEEESRRIMRKFEEENNKSVSWKVTEK